MIKMYKKIQRLTLVLKSFTTCQWNFDDTNVETLWHQMDARDQALFPFNIQDVDWDDYVDNNARGVRLYVLLDTHEHSQYAKRRYLMLRAANLMLWTSLTSMLVYGVSNMIPKSRL
uniref:Fatty acyl-CoA reductase CG5065 n=2 Tax=Cacopsylla melanoneura TaxID=428564 RepID=A0A8D8X5Q6_9HEMI